MKSLRDKTKYRLSEMSEFSSFKSTEDVLITKSPKKLLRNYIGFFVVYFSLSSINIYLTVYLPVYLLSILNVNRSELAFIQIFAFSILFLAPAFGFLFDKYSQHKKTMIVISMWIFLFSSLATLFSGMILYIFGLFFTLNLLSYEIIKVGMSRILIGLSINEEIKDRNLIVINVSSNIGGFIPSLFFIFIVTDVFNLNLWTVFFFLGGVSLIPILFATFCFNYMYTNKEIEKNQEIKENYGKIKYFNLVFLMLSFIMIWSDKLYLYPFTPWILAKFGQLGLKLLSLSYGFFLLVNVIGYMLGHKISKHLKRRNVILLMNSLYISLIFLMAFSNLIFFLILYTLNWFVSGIMMLNYSSIIISISKNTKYQTVSYQMFRFAVAIASIVFIPLGTFLSIFIPTEVLILLAGFLSIFSLVPLIFIKLK